jgi:hypothetical protein
LFYRSFKQGTPLAISLTEALLKIEYPVMAVGAAVGAIVGAIISSRGEVVYKAP